MLAGHGTCVARECRTCLHRLSLFRISVPGHFRALHVHRKQPAAAEEAEEYEPDGGSSNPLEYEHERTTCDRESTMWRGDFALGLSIRQHLTGYALLCFRTLEPLQLGLIDVRKSTEVQAKAQEISAVLKDLRTIAPQKLPLDAADNRNVTSGRRWQWVIGVDDYSLDRSTPSNAASNAAQRANAMLQGLVLGDCRRLLRAAPLLLHPRRSRSLLGVRGVGPAGRQEVFELATTRVRDFPTIKKRSGALDEDTLLMSDAWAAARYSQRVTLLERRLSDAQLVESLRQEALASKKLRKISVAIGELYPRKAAHDLTKVLESRVERMVKARIHQMLNEEHSSGYTERMVS